MLQPRGMMQQEEARKVEETPAEVFSFSRQEELGKTPDRIEALSS